MKRARRSVVIVVAGVVATTAIIVGYDNDTTTDSAAARSVPDTGVAVPDTGVAVPDTGVELRLDDRRKVEASSDSTGSTDASGRARFTVAILPLVVTAADQKAQVAFETIHRQFIAELRAIPNLVLVEIESADEMTDDIDFGLDVTALSSSDPREAWSYRINWIATIGRRGAWIESDDTSSLPMVDTVARDAAAAVRRFPFPPQDSRARELAAYILDTRNSFGERMDALVELEEIPERLAFVGREGDRTVAEAAVDVVVNSAEADVRMRVWRAMTNIDDPYLIQPLVDSLLHDASEPVRVEAIRLLTRKFADNVNVRVAIEYALAHDASPAVKLHAQWETLDAQARRELVAETVQNRDLPDIERLKLLTAGVKDFSLFVDQRSTAALGEIAARARPSVEPPAAFAANIRALGSEQAGDDDQSRVDAELIVPLLIDLLREAENPQVRLNAASALMRHTNEPGVREMLILTSNDDPSSMVRSQMSWLVSRLQR